MRLRKTMAIVPFIAVLGLVFGQDGPQLHPSSHERMEQEVQKHRTEVVKKLNTLPIPETPFDFLSFGIQGRTVVLLGFTIRPVLKTNAEGAVKQLSWVENVVNEILVLPLNPEDRQIRVQSLAILQSSVRQAFPENHADIRIKLLRGDVTLVGFISEIDSKRLENAVIQIQHLPFVRKVTNNISVRSKES